VPPSARILKGQSRPSVGFSVAFSLRTTAMADDRDKTVLTLTFAFEIAARSDFTMGSPSSTAQRVSRL
jgi:hypothetical protein